MVSVAACDSAIKILLNYIENGERNKKCSTIVFEPWNLQTLSLVIFATYLQFWDSVNTLSSYNKVLEIYNHLTLKTS